MTEMNEFDAKDMMKDLPLHFAHFPSLLELKEFSLRYIKKKKVEAPAQAFHWISTKAPGTPPSLEAIFEWISNKEFSSSKMEYAIRCLGINEDVLMEWHHEWTQGKVHPDVKERTELLSWNSLHKNKK